MGGVDGVIGGGGGVGGMGEIFIGGGGVLGIEIKWLLECGKNLFFVVCIK